MFHDPPFVRVSGTHALIIGSQADVAGAGEQPGNLQWTMTHYLQAHLFLLKIKADNDRYVSMCAMGGRPCGVAAGDAQAWLMVKLIY